MDTLPVETKGRKHIVDITSNSKPSFNGRISRMAGAMFFTSYYRCADNW